MPALQSLNSHDQQSGYGGIRLPKKKEVAISSEPVYKSPPAKVIKNPKKPVK